MSHRDEYFYYYEEYFYATYRAPRGRHTSHIWEEEYASEEEGSKTAKVYEEFLRDEIRYYIELPGVTSPEDIEITLEGANLKVVAKIKKTIIYPGLRKKVKLSEYRADIRLPFRPDPNDILTEFDSRKSLLIIRVRKRSKSYKLNIDRVY